MKKTKSVKKEKEVVVICGPREAPIEMCRAGEFWGKFIVSASKKAGIDARIRKERK